MFKPEDLKNNPRVRACEMIRDSLGKSADCKIANVVQLPVEHHAAANDLLDQLGVKDVSVPEQHFGQYQLYLDLPGNAAAWGSFRQYLFGCAVIRPLPATRELAYYRRLEPGKDFIPVAADLSDLADKVRHALANPEETAAIACSGRRKIIEYMRALPDIVPAIFDAFSGAQETSASDAVS